MRTCDVCGRKMTEGYVVDDSNYYCSNKCLHSVHSREEYDEMYEEGDAYWTQWEEVDDED